MSLRPLILVVDDEPQIQRFLRPALMAAGYDVEHAATSAEARRLAQAHAPALVILDLGLPDADGKSVIVALRQRMEIPIIVLSARDQETEKVAALDLGADDYVAKPFGIRELLARIRVCLRAGVPDSSPRERLEVGALAIDLRRRQVTLSDAPIRLTPKEFDLLTLLAMHPGRVMTHRQILEKIWGPAHGEDTPYLRVFIGQLRSKIEANPASPRMILTEPGVGYRISEDD